MNPDFYIKEGDRNPSITATLVDENGDAIDLTTAAAVKFFMIDPGDSTPKVNGSNASIIDAVGGRVRYNWGANDTDTPGDYDGEFEIEWNSGEKTTFPNFRFIRIKIWKSIDTTD